MGENSSASFSSTLVPMSKRIFLYESHNLFLNGVISESQNASAAKGGFCQVYLTNREQDFLLVTVAAWLAKERMSKGIKLNYPEAIAVIVSHVFETARLGSKTVEEIEKDASKILSPEDVMEGVPAMIEAIDIEATFPDGTKLVVLRNPIKPKHQGGVGQSQSSTH